MVNSVLKSFGCTVIIFVGKAEQCPTSVLIACLPRQQA
jgi:hypothetical protein